MKYKKAIVIVFAVAKKAFSNGRLHQLKRIKVREPEGEFEVIVWPAYLVRVMDAFINDYFRKNPIRKTAQKVEDNGATFSDCRNYRYALWRIWDRSKPLVMFIGLNPSTANETEPDNTIKRVRRIAESNGFGGFYMMNCFPYVSTDPAKLKDGLTLESNTQNVEKLTEVGSKCKETVFAWGNFKEVDDYVSGLLSFMFPNAKALHINKNGSPKHPLFCRSNSPLIPFKQ